MTDMVAPRDYLPAPRGAFGEISRFGSRRRDPDHSPQSFPPEKPTPRGRSPGSNGTFQVDDPRPERQKSSRLPPETGDARIGSSPRAVLRRQQERLSFRRNKNI